MVPIARRYLLSDRVRLGISAGGVAFAVLLIVLILALYRGIYDQAGKLATSPPADLWVMQAGTADPSHGASVLPGSVLMQLREVPGVAAVQPLLARTMEAGTRPNTGTFAFVMALPDGPLQAETAKAFGLRSLPGDGQMVLSGPASQDIGAGPGDTVFIGVNAFQVTDVSPIVGSAFSGAVFVSPDVARELFGSGDAFSFALVAIAPGAAVEQVGGQIEARFPSLNALTRDEFADATRREVEDGFLPIISVLIGVSFVVGLAVVALTIYTSTVERVREYGVLKAIGASPRQLFAVVVRQSAVVSLIGFAVGSTLGVVVGDALGDAVPEFATLYRWQDILAVLAAALLMSAVAAVVPIRRVARVDPAIVFRA